MSKLLLVTILALSLVVSSCGGSDDSTASAEHAGDTDASVTQVKSLASQASATQPAKKSSGNLIGPDIAGLYLGLPFTHKPQQDNIIHHPSPITHHPSPITHHPSSISEYPALMY
ncbi:MAG: hypothetical protein NUV75_00355 [Gallionella sp.]|nr:hypothetical protein [Gallionella sp.]